MRQWWGRLGEGYSVPVCEIDLRVGGRWRFVNQHPKGSAEFYGEYRELDPPHRVVFTEIFADFPDAESVVTSELTAEGARTRLTATVRYPSQQIRDIVVGTGMAKGPLSATTGSRISSPSCSGGMKAATDCTGYADTLGFICVTREKSVADSSVAPE